jgi:acyl carrier protein
MSGASVEQIKRDLARVVIEVNPKVVVRDERDYGRPAKDIGIDSLDMMSILLSLQERYGIEIPDEDVDRLGTLGEIAAYVETAMKAKP